MTPDHIALAILAGAFVASLVVMSLDGNQA